VLEAMRPSGTLAALVFFFASAAGGTPLVPTRRHRGGVRRPPYRDAELSQSAVTAEVRRTSFNPTGPPVRGLSVESSTRPVTGSFRYTYALLGPSGADAIAIGYVTYRVPEASPR
jgi:hypothetical protein